MGRWLRHGLGVGITAIFLLPFFWLLLAAVQPVGVPPPPGLPGWPPQPAWGNYAQLFALLPMGRYLFNSLLVVATAVPLTVLVASTAGFALAQEGARARRRWLWAHLLLLLLPGAAVWLWRYQILAWLGWVDTRWAYVAPAFFGGTPLFVLLYFWAHRRIPGALYEAARLDGVTAVQMWWWVTRPLTTPTTIAVAILSFALYWGDFVTPVLYVFRADLYTLPVGLQILRQLDATNWPLLMAGAVVMVLPVLLLLLLLQRVFLREFALTFAEEG